MNEKNLALFIREILIILYNNQIYINNLLIDNINNFIYQYYKDNKSLFKLLFSNTELLEEFIAHNYQILPPEVAYWLSHKYASIDQYIELLDYVSGETETEINKLVQMFISYHNEVVDLYNIQTRNPIRILQ